MNRRLPLEKVLLGAIVVPWRARRAFLRGLAIPGAALVAFDVAWWSTNGAHIEPWMGWTLWASYWLLIMIFSITCHRLVLLGAGETALLPPFTRREARFAARMIAATLIYAAVQFGLLWSATFLLANVGLENAANDGQYWLNWIAALAGVYVFGRLATMFPATAIENPTGLREAWRRTHGNGWRMALVVGPIPWVVNYATGWLYGAAPGLWGAAGASLLIALFLVFQVSALSLSYRELSAAAEPA